MTLNFDFSGKSVIVTGGSKGIGIQLVENLAKCGCKVFSLSRTTDTIESLIKDKPNLDIIAIKCDISKWDELNSVAKSLPHVDFLVNNAGIAKLEDFGKIKQEEIDIMFNTNIKAIINLSQVVANYWKQKGVKGVIVNISSQASQRALNSHTIYCATKAAVDSLTRSMALELGPFNIRVNSVNPTAILTDMGRLYWEDKIETLRPRIPLQRLCEVKEAVDVIMYLLTDHCTLVTGAAIPVDGGFWAS